MKTIHFAYLGILFIYGVDLPEYVVLHKALHLAGQGSPGKQLLPINTHISTPLGHTGQHFFDQRRNKRTGWCVY